MRINYIGQADTTGYGVAAGQYLRLLAKSGVTVGYQPMLPNGRYQCEPWSRAPEHIRRYTVPEIFPEADTILHTVPEYFPELTKSMRMRGATGRMLGMTVWETSRLPSHWANILNDLDGVIVPSAWNVKVFRESGVIKPVYCLPHASEFEGEPPTVEACAQLHRRLPDLSGKFVFYSVGAWTYRKGNDLLLKAFREAFHDREDVALILKTSPIAFGAHLTLRRRILQKLRLRPSFRPADASARAEGSVVILTDDLPPEELAALHTVGDCYVSCTHGEGWGMGVYEAAWFRNPILAPDKGGHLAYFPPDDPTGLVKSTICAVPRQARDRSYSKEQQWVDIDLRELITAMKAVAKSSEGARITAEDRHRFLSQNFSRGVIASLFLGILQQNPSRDQN